MLRIHDDGNFAGKLLDNLKIRKKSYNQDAKAKKGYVKRDILNVMDRHVIDPLSSDHCMAI